MADNKNDDQRLERIMNHLADSVLGLSDEAIVAEISEAGGDPAEQAQRTSRILRQASQVLDHVNWRLSKLGHTVNSNSWRRASSAYHNHCVKCGLAVSFATKTGKIVGSAFDAPCSVTNAYGPYKVAKTASE